VAERRLPRRLSPLDAAFLYLETDEGPLHVGGISIVEGDVRASALAAHLATGLHETPRYRQRVASPPLGLGHPVWERDRAFALDQHVIESRVAPPGDEAALRAHAAALLARRLPRDRPLWDLNVVRGLAGGRSAVVSRIHHCMVDGISGVDLMQYVFGTADGRAPRRPPPPEVAPPASDVALVLEAVLEAAGTAWRLGGDVAHGLATLRASWRETMDRALGATAALAGSAAQPVRRLPFNRTLTGQRRLGFARWPVAELRAIAQARGGTVNDVVLALLADAIGRWLAARGERVDGHALRVLVPVNVRRDEEHALQGNRVSMIPVEVPLWTGAVERLDATIARTAAMKRAGVAALVERAAELGDAVPAALYAAVLSVAVSPGALQWSAPLRAARVVTANMVCTNVPGPAVPLTCLGHPVVAHYPFVPLAFETGLGCAVFTYNQALFLTLVSDAGAIEDLDPLLVHLGEARSALQAAPAVHA
jgi:WS/DGAT/MGAT family acyltransferase